MRRPSPAFWMELPADDEDGEPQARADQFYIRDRKTGAMRLLELAYVSPGDADTDAGDVDEEEPGRLQ